tara:strand:+ start:5228 stop:5473 length:246 start_codon:yes stop_codon:yes gene_type:complete
MKNVTIDDEGIIALGALRLIRQKYGKVCPEFEICKHESCRSSVSSWFVADMIIQLLDTSEREVYSNEEIDNLLEEMGLVLV